MVTVLQQTKSSANGHQILVKSPSPPMIGGRWSVLGSPAIKRRWICDLSFFLEKTQLDNLMHLFLSRFPEFFLFRLPPLSWGPGSCFSCRAALSKIPQIHKCWSGSSSSSKSAFLADRQWTKKNEGALCRGPRLPDTGDRKERHPLTFSIS